MRSWSLLLVLGSMLAAAGCQSVPSTTADMSECTWRAQDAGYCYGIALPARLGL